MYITSSLHLHELFEKINELLMIILQGVHHLFLVEQEQTFKVIRTCSENAHNTSPKVFEIIAKSTLNNHREIF
jgi:hypothetical protein